ncbi:glycosyltransferase, partial [Candidatus Omnitrophota bacterium]
ATWLLTKPRALYLSSFKCLNRFTIDEITKYKGPFPYIDGLILRCTRNIGTVEVRHDKRKEGRSGYTLKKLIRLWINMFVNFSVHPLRVSTILGFFLFISGILLSVFLIIDKMMHPEIPMGVTSILVGILVFAGVQMVMLGLIGEYLGKQFIMTNQTPQYVVRESFSTKKEGNIDEEYEAVSGRKVL